MANATFTYQWIKLDSNLNDSDISGATASTYTLVAADAGTGIKVRVSFTDDAGNTESLTNESAIVMAANNPATGAPTISGTAQVGETLTASTTGIADSDGLAFATFTYQWLADDAGHHGRDRRDLHAGCRRRRQGHQGPGVIHRRRGQYRVADQRGNGDSDCRQHPATGAPTISGTAQVGETLTAKRHGHSRH